MSSRTQIESGGLKEANCWLSKLLNLMLIPKDFYDYLRSIEIVFKERRPMFRRFCGHGFLHDSHPILQQTADSVSFAFGIVRTDPFKSVVELNYHLSRHEFQCCLTNIA